MKYVHISYLDVKLNKWNNANSEIMKHTGIERSGCSFAPLPLILTVIYLDF